MREERAARARPARHAEVHLHLLGLPTVPQSHLRTVRNPLSPSRLFIQPCPRGWPNLCATSGERVRAAGEQPLHLPSEAKMTGRGAAAGMLQSASSHAQTQAGRQTNTSPFRDEASSVSADAT